MEAENEKIFRAWYQLLESPPKALIEMLAANVSDSQNDLSLHSTCEAFLKEYFNKNVPVEYHKKLPKRRVYGKSMRVSVNANDIYDGTNPICFTFEGKKIRVRHAAWKHLLVQLCELIAKDYPEDFNLVKHHICGAKRDYFSESQSALGLGKPIVGTNLFVETRLSANNIKELCDVLLRYFDYGYRLEVEVERI